MKNDPDEEAALKWVALAVLHGINEHAREIAVTRSAHGDVEVTAKYWEARLPSPGEEIGKKIIAALRDIGHIESGEGKLPLAMGIREDSLELNLEVQSNEQKETVTLTFPH